MGRGKDLYIKKRFKAYSSANERGSIMINEYGCLQKWISYFYENCKSTVNVQNRWGNVTFL